MEDIKFFKCEDCGGYIPTTTDCDSCEAIRNLPEYFELRREVHDYEKNGLQLTDIEDVKEKMLKEMKTNFEKGKNKCKNTIK